ncbi:MAG: hypothetical protein JW956_11715 [Calditrichaceae bacterium]|nr:hypothetical protein [Calditrichaceae bacterium]
MRLSIQKIFILISAAFIFSSCAAVYVPNVAHTTFYEENGDLSVSGFVGSTGYDGQVSFAMTDNLYLYGAASYLKEDSTNNENNDEDYLKHKYQEGAIGFYHCMGSSGRYTMHMGMGHGESEAYDSYVFFGDNELMAKGKYRKYFFQSALGMSKDIVDLGGAIRYNYVDFYKFSTTSENIPGVEHIFNQFIEPSFFVRVGYKYIKWHFQYSVAIGLRDESPFDYRANRISMGITFKYNILGKNF